MDVKVGESRDFYIHVSMYFKRNFFFFEIGIGTGWATKIPNHNPRQIIRCLRKMIQGDEPGKLFSLKELICISLSIFSFPFSRNIAPMVQEFQRNR